MSSYYSYVQVDLKCTVTGHGGQYYPEHLPILGKHAGNFSQCIYMYCIYHLSHIYTSVLCAGSDTVHFFDEEEIVAGDVVSVKLDPEVFKMIQEARHRWEEQMSEVRVLQSSYIRSSLTTVLGKTNLTLN